MFSENEKNNFSRCSIYMHRSGQELYSTKLFVNHFIFLAQSFAVVIRLKLHIDSPSRFKSPVQTTGLDCDWTSKLSTWVSYWRKLKRLRDKSEAS